MIKNFNTMVRKIVPLLIFLFLLTGCSTWYDVGNTDRRKSRQYINKPPEQDFSPKFAKLSKSIVRPQCYVAYEQYRFPKSEQVTRNSLEEHLLQQNDNNTNINRENSVGTGVILDSNKDSVLILSSAHIFDYPDSIYQYFNQEGFKNNLSLFSKKISQKQYIVTKNKIISLEIFIQSKSKDLILFIGKGLKDSLNTPSISSSSQLGKSGQLKYGDLVYMFGYPTGRKMITDGIVSPTQSGGNFLINTPFNKGMSGGIVLAFDKQNKFEIVGMATSSAAEHQYILTPESDVEREKYNKTFPYQGESYVKRQAILKYGVTFVTGADTIANFMKMHAAKIREAGFNLEGILTKQ